MTGTRPPASAATISLSMKRGRNGGEAGEVTQIAASALAARACGARPFLFHRSRTVLRSSTRTILPSDGLSGSGSSSTMSPGAMGFQARASALSTFPLILH